MFTFLAIIGILYEVINIIFAKWAIYLNGKILYPGPKGYTPHKALYIIMGLLYMILVISWFFTGHTIFGAVVLGLYFISVFLKKKLFHGLEPIQSFVFLSFSYSYIWDRSKI